MIKILSALIFSHASNQALGFQNLEALQFVHKNLFAQFNISNDYEGAINANLARNELPIFTNSSKVIVKSDINT